MTASEPSIVIVIPAYRGPARSFGILAKIPAEVQHVVVVDDSSPDSLQEVLEEVTDPPVLVLRQSRTGVLAER